MARKQDIFTLIGRRMRTSASPSAFRGDTADMPPIADLIRRIDHALAHRRAA